MREKGQTSCGISDGFVKSSRSRRALFRFVRRTYVRRSKHEMKRNADIGLFTESSELMRVCEMQPKIRAVVVYENVLDDPELYNSHV